VNAVNAKGAGGFTSGGTSAFETLQMAASGGLAYWVGIQHFTVRKRGEAQSVPMNLRVTEVFRREEGDWKLVHRHADALKSELP
jgi:ketosteroid isomerase-like protein